MQVPAPKRTHARTTLELVVGTCPLSPPRPRIKNDTPPCIKTARKLAKALPPPDDEEEEGGWIMKVKEPWGVRYVHF